MPNGQGGIGVSRLERAEELLRELVYLSDRGTDPESASWGRMIQAARAFLDEAQGEVIQRHYPDGTRQTMSTPGGLFQYFDDADGRPDHLINPFNETTGWTYFNSGDLHTQTLANGAVTTYTYDALHMPIDIKTAGGSLLSDFSGITYDRGYNLNGVTASIPSAASLSGTTAYQYDDQNELLQEFTTRAGGALNLFAYDDNGNPTTFRSSPLGAFNADNQITTVSYDAEGNPLSDRLGRNLERAVSKSFCGVF